MRRLTAGVVAIFLSSSGIAPAANLTESLSQDNSATFEDYYYEVYGFESSGAPDAFIAVLSTDFDAFLILVAPDITVLTNDDGILPIGDATSRDAVLPIPDEPQGRWIAVATSFDRDRRGAFTLRYEGVSDLRRLDRANVDQQLIARAFEKRGVVNAEVRREQAVAKLAELLSLSSYREEMRTNLSETRSAARAAMEEVEQREATIMQAIAEVQSLQAGRALVLDLLEQALGRVQSDAERSADRILRARSAAEALDFLEKIDQLSTQLALAEVTLLNANNLDALLASKAEVLRLRALSERTRRELAERLVDSELWVAANMYGVEISVGDRDSGSTLHSVQESYTVSRSGSGLVSPSTTIGGGEIGAATAVSGSDWGAFAATVWFPSLLPWPPPDASARSVISNELLMDSGVLPRSLGDADDVLSEALSDAGYHDYAYLGVPNGFAIVTRIEQTDAEGAPLDGIARWSTQIEPLKSFSIQSYIRALLTAPPGYFRVVLFVVTSEPFRYSGARAQLVTLERWSREGLNVLPPHIRDEPMTDAHRVTTLVYEFEKLTETDEPETRIPGRVAMAEHLAHTRFAAYMR